MRRLLALLVVFGLALAVTGCGDGPKTETPKEFTPTPKDPPIGAGGGGGAKPGQGVPGGQAGAAQ